MEENAGDERAQSATSRQCVDVNVIIGEHVSRVVKLLAFFTIFRMNKVAQPDQSVPHDFI